MNLGTSWCVVSKFLQSNIDWWAKIFLPKMAFNLVKYKRQFYSRISIQFCITIEKDDTFMKSIIIHLKFDKHAHAISWSEFETFSSYMKIWTSILSRQLFLDSSNILYMYSFNIIWSSDPSYYSAMVIVWRPD